MNQQEPTNKAEALARKLARCAWELEATVTLTPQDAAALCDLFRDSEALSDDAERFNDLLHKQLQRAHCESYPRDCDDWYDD